MGDAKMARFVSGVAPTLCRQLAAECREDDARMSGAPWRYDHGGWIDSDNSTISHTGSETEVLTLGARNESGDGQGAARARNNLGAIAAQLTAAADLSERPTLTEERVREVVSMAVDVELMKRGFRGALGINQTAVRDAIATRAAKELAGAVVGRPAPICPDGWPDVFDPAAAEAAIAVMLEQYGNAPGIAELVVELSWAIAQLRAERAAPLAAAFDRASRVITGESAAELNERLTIESRKHGEPFAPTDAAPSMGDWDPPTSPAPRETMAEVQESGERVHVARKDGDK